VPTLDWIGKAAVVNHHHKVRYHLLRCDRQLSAGDAEAGNLLVQGDNLLALKALLPYYAGKVKCIYIAPPYNTGNEGWVYNDNVNSPEIRQWQLRRRRGRQTPTGLRRVAHPDLSRHRQLRLRQPHPDLEPVMSTSWQWFPETKEAICNYCGFRATYKDDVPGHLEHECDPAKHPALTARQGLPIGRSPRPNAASRVPRGQLLACIHRGPEDRQEPCETCGGGVRIKIFACAVHGECQLDDKIAGVKFCGGCHERALATV